MLNRDNRVDFLFVIVGNVFVNLRVRSPCTVLPRYARVNTVIFVCYNDGDGHASGLGPPAW